MAGPPIHLDFALRRTASVVERLAIDPENMLKNLDRLGRLAHGQRVLLALTQKGVSREDAYTAVQRNAMKVLRVEGTFIDLLNQDRDIRPHLGKSELNHIFDPRHHYENVDRVFGRAFWD